MTVHISTFTGKVQKVETFGKVVKVTLVHLPRKDSGYEPSYIEGIFKADGFDGKLMASLQRDDEGVQFSGRTERKKWKNGNGYSMEMPFPTVEVPWALRKRFLDKGKDGPQDLGPIDETSVDTDIPF